MTGSPYIPCALNSRTEDFTGQRRGMLVAIRPLRHSARASVHWEVRCDCGTVKIMRAQGFKTRSRSCGCMVVPAVRKAQTVTGMTNTPTYRAWVSMRARCDKPTERSYPNYGGRGISYDPRWAHFLAFLADMGVAPDGLQLDRRDNSGHYNKDNCRWATLIENQNNKRTSHFVDFRGERLTVAQLARKVGIDSDRIYQRIRRGWSAESAVSTPFDHRFAPRRASAPARA